MALGRWVSVLAFDPGVTTGWVEATVWVDGDASMKEICDRRIGVRWGEFGWVDDHARTAREIVYHIREFAKRASLLGGERYVVMEDFILHSMGSTGVDGIAPARIGWYVKGMLAGIMYDRMREGTLDEGLWGAEGPAEQIVWYLPGARGSVVDSDRRLREWGLWVPGKPHARDAWKMWALHVRKLRNVTT